MIYNIISSNIISTGLDYFGFRNIIRVLRKRGESKMTKSVLSRILATILILALMFPTVLATEGEANTAKLQWDELEERIRTGNLNFQAIDKNASSIESIDYDNMYNSLRKQLEDLSAMQSLLAGTRDFAGLDALNSATASLRDTYNDIRDGKPQRDSKNAINQLRDAQNQIVIGGQMLYINILAMEQSLRDGERGIAAIDRTLSELRIRRIFGQVSDKTVEDVEFTRNNTQSSLTTLKSTIASYKAQLQLLIGEEPTGELELGALPELYREDEIKPDVEADLLVAKEKSQGIENAELELEKAQESLRDTDEAYKRNEIKRYQLTSAENTAEAAEFTYRSAVQNFELSFRDAYRALENSRQVLKNKELAVEYQKKQLAFSERQYSLGRISYFAYLTAEDNLKTAESELETAKRDYFTALNKYNNADKYGIIA